MECIGGWSHSRISTRRVLRPFSKINDARDIDAAVRIEAPVTSIFMPVPC